LAALLVAYAFSPIDLIPDFIPILGYIDEIILLPTGIYFCLKLVPAPVLVECRERAEAWVSARGAKPKSYMAAAIVLLIWTGLTWWLWETFGRRLLEG
jgi:uncharacterized membrane protein YkvA (DUF1232 family)